MGIFKTQDDGRPILHSFSKNLGNFSLENKLDEKEITFH